MKERKRNEPRPPQTQESTAPADGGLEDAMAEVDRALARIALSDSETFLAQSSQTGGQ